MRVGVGAAGLGLLGEDRFEVFAQCCGDARGDQLHYLLIDHRMFFLHQHPNLDPA